MQTKVIDKIVLSESAPSNKNVAWLKPSTEGGGLSLKVYKDQEWSKVETTSSSDGDGGSTPDTPSGEYYLARPNGWYWKYVGDKILTKDSELYNGWGGYLLMLTGNDILYSVLGDKYYELPFVWLFPINVLTYIEQDTNIDFTYFIGYAEKAITCSELGLASESFYEFMVLNTGQEMSESDFESFMFASFGLQRITKEEYESLIIK